MEAYVVRACYCLDDQHSAWVLCWTALCEDSDEERISANK